MSPDASLDSTTNKTQPPPRQQQQHASTSTTDDSCPYTAAVDNEDTMLKDDDDEDNDLFVMRVLQWCMRAITGLLLLSALLTAMIAQQFRLVLLCFWGILLFFWMGLSWFLPSLLLTPQTRRRRVIHSLVQDMAQHLQDFCVDCREEVALLLLTSDNNRQQPRRRRPTRFFRVAVRPILRVMLRARRRKNRTNDEGLAG